MEDKHESTKEEESHEMTDQHSAGEHTTHNSQWPILLAIGIGFIPIGIVNYIWGNKFGLGLIIFGAVMTLGSLAGWANTLIKEKLQLLDLEEKDRWLRNGMKLFLVSEAAIFGALFAHHYYAKTHFPVWPPEGAPHLDTRLPAIATLILMSSSFTIQWAHSLLQRRNFAWCKRFVVLTILLGAIFLWMQGNEWGFLKAYDQFTVKSGTFGTSFFMMTGFHGLHVSIGLILLFITYIRLRLGHFQDKRHFSFVAASWYWHFVDIVWVFLFGTIYLV